MEEGIFLGTSKLMVVISLRFACMFFPNDIKRLLKFPALLNLSVIVCSFISSDDGKNISFLL